MTLSQEKRGRNRFSHALENLFLEVQHSFLSKKQGLLFSGLLFPWQKRSYDARCRSWAKVSAHVEKWLYSPRRHHLLLMTVLDHERDKFSGCSFYGARLAVLQRLISKGMKDLLIRKDRA